MPPAAALETRHATAIPNHGPVGIQDDDRAAVEPHSQPGKVEAVTLPDPEHVMRVPAERQRLTGPSIERQRVRVIDHPRPCRRIAPETGRGRAVKAFQPFGYVVGQIAVSARLASRGGIGWRNDTPLRRRIEKGRNLVPPARHERHHGRPG